jgi:nucleoside-diphosphate-sugar epimerase
MSSSGSSGTATSGDEPASRILVTGSSGIVGRRVVSELRSRGLSRQIIEFVGDISSQQEVNEFFIRTGRIAACIHLAALVPLATAEADPIRAYEVNAVGTGRIIDAIGQHSGDAYFLHCSTSHVYSASKVPLQESAPLEPSSTYGRSKLAAEMIASDVASRAQVRLLIARIFSLWAEDQEGTFLYPALAKKFAAAKPGESVRVTGGNNVRDFLHADEVSYLLVELLRRETQGVVNIASGRSTSVIDFARQHAPQGVRVESEDSAMATSIVADTVRLKDVLRD